MQREKTKTFSPDDVITALLAFLPPEFSNDPEKIHTTIRKLQQEEKYKDLLEDFEFLDYPRFPYSPLLGRIFNRLQTRCISGPFIFPEIRMGHSGRQHQVIVGNVTTRKVCQLFL